MKSLSEIKNDLNDIEILPRAAFSFSTRNRKTGQESGKKGIALSFSVTLWHLIGIALIAICALSALSALRVALRKSRIKREVRKALKKKEKK